MTNITERGISFSDYEKFISEEEYETIYRHFSVAKGDLLLSSSGNSWGKVATFDSDDVAILNTSTIRVNENPGRKAIRRFLGWLLISEGTREQLRLFMTGSCQPNFGPSHLSRVLVAIPPLPEQAAIASIWTRSRRNWTPWRPRWRQRWSGCRNTAPPSSPPPSPARLTSARNNMAKKYGNYRN